MSCAIASIQRIVMLMASLVWAGLSWAQPVAGTQLSTVAVWDFDDQTVYEATTLSQLDFLKRTLPEAVIGMLLPSFKVVERMRLNEILTEQKLGSSDLADADARIRLGRMTGAQRMVFGSFMAVGDQIRVNLRAVDTATSQVVYADEYTTGYDLVLNEAQKMAMRLSRALGGSLIQPSKVQATIALWAEYDHALALTDTGYYAEAIDALKNLLAKDKDFSSAERQLTAILEKLSRQ